MNWKFTRPDTGVEFLQDEPIGMVVPQQLELLENALPVIINMDEDQELSGKFEKYGGKACGTSTNAFIIENRLPSGGGGSGTICAGARHMQVMM